jgi:hypothetical protein
VKRKTAPKSGAPIAEAVPAADSFEERAAKIQAALTGIYGDPWATGGTRWSVRATFDDAVVVELAGDLKRFPITVDAAGALALGTPEDVEVVYRGLNESIGARVLGPILEEGQKKPGSKWAAVIITAGLSKNRTSYSSDVLREAVPLYEGAKVFWNHVKGGAGDTPMRDPRDIAGFLTGVKFAVMEGAAQTGAILATLNATSPALRDLLLEAHEAEKPDLVGLSHSVQAEIERVRLADGPATRVKKIAAVESVDVVSFPSAGGRVARLVAGLSSPVPVTEEELLMLQKKLDKLKESRPDLFAKLGAEPTEAAVDALLLEAIGTKAPEAAPAAVAPPAPAAAPVAKVEEAKTSAISEAAAKRLLALEHRFTVETLLEGRTMPEAMKVSLRESLLARVGEEEPVMKAEVDRFVALAAKMAESGPAGSGLGRVEATKDEVEKLVEGLDGFFMRTADGDSAEIRKTYEKRFGKKAGDGFGSFKEAYVAITGDRGITGLLENAQGLSRFARLSEAMTTASWPKILGDSIRRAMLADYGTISYLDQWRAIVSDIGTISDFRTNRRLRLGGYSDLPVVAEQGTYLPVASPSDEEATYAISKKGGLESVTLEQIANDDVGAIRRIPMQLSRAAKRSLYKAVFAPILNNANVYDAVALAAGGHNNLINAALSAAQVSVARQLLAKQTSFGGTDTLNLYPKTLIVPPELEELAWRLVNVAVANTANQNATEASFQRAMGLSQYVVLPYTGTSFVGGNDWWVVADPNDVPTIEVGFYQGRQEPELFTQDQPNVGSLFSADKIDYKIRFIFGVAVLDFRGFVGGLN